MSYVVTFGKFKDKAIDTLPIHDLLGYAGYLIKRATEEGKPLSRGAYEYTKEVLKYATENLDTEIKKAAELKAQAPADGGSIPF